MSRAEPLAPVETHKTVLEISREDQAVHVTKMTAECREFGTNLLQLFNVDFVEHVQKVGPNNYRPVFLPSRATHVLVGTSWRTDKQDREICTNGFALSVAARPLRPRLRQSSLELREAIPATAPIFRNDGPLDGKRGVLRWIITATMKPRAGKRLIKEIGHMSHEECNQIYVRLRRASLVIRLS